LPDAAPEALVGANDDITVGAQTIRVHLAGDGSATVVHAIDISTGVAYTSLMESNVARHVKGTVQRSA
jgi:hypothetical protein